MFPSFRYYNNDYYAKVGGLGPGEINRLELEFLFKIDFRLNVTPDLFHGYHQLLEVQQIQSLQPQPPRLSLPERSSTKSSVRSPVSVMECDSEVWGEEGSQSRPHVYHSSQRLNSSWR